MKKTWSLNSWKKYKAEQQPEWEKKTLYNEVLEKINQYPPRVFAG